MEACSQEEHLFAGAAAAALVQCLQQLQLFFCDKDGMCFIGTDASPCTVWQLEVCGGSPVVTWSFGELLLGRLAMFICIGVRCWGVHVCLFEGGLGACVLRTACSITPAHASFQ